VRAPLVLLAAIGVLILGTFGYTHSSEGDYNWWEAFFKSFQLFAFAGGDVNSADPLSLNIAKVLAPLLVGYAAIRGLIVLSREQLRLLGFRLFRRNHVVVAGLGDVGFRLADVLNERGARVIAVDRDPAKPSFEGCRERGISVLAGDATDPDTLRAASVERAAHLVIAPGSDAVTIDVLAAAERIKADRRAGQPLRVLAHVEGRALWRAMQAWALSHPANAGVSVELFNLYESSARLLLEEHPPFSAEAAAGRSSPRVLVISDQPLGEILVLNTARLWQLSRSRGRWRITVDLAVPDAAATCRRLIAENPSLDGLCDLEPWEVTPGSALLHGDERARDASAVYVAVADEAAGLASCMAVAGGRADGTPVLITNDERLGAAAVADRSGIAVFGILSRTLTPEFLSSGLTEIIARAMHSSYVREQRALGATPAALPNLADWDELSDEAQQANRNFAAGIPDKLAAVGRIVVPMPLVELDRVDGAFDAREVERLAELEHERWVSDKERAGFTYGPERDDSARMHPSLVPYAELPESEKDKDRTAVRDLPRMLADAGFAIERA
jgi:hypothetical protein